MQRPSFPTPYGQLLHAPSVAPNWGVVNPTPESFSAIGAMGGEMMGQSDELSDIAAHAAIVTRLQGTWSSVKAETLVAGTVLAVVTKREDNNGDSVQPSERPGICKIYHDTIADDKNPDNKPNLRTDHTLRFVVLANDLLGVEKDAQIPPAAIASQSVALVCPTHKMAPHCSGDAVYAYTDPKGVIKLICDPDNMGPPCSTTWHLLGYVTVPAIPNSDDSSLWVCLVPQER